MSLSGGQNLLLYLGGQDVFLKRVSFTNTSSNNFIFKVLVTPCSTTTIFMYSESRLSIGCNILDA
jgi:hypothetical protein